MSQRTTSISTGRQALIHALSDYEGAVILISHDRHLVEATADRLWIVRHGTVASYDGDMDSYRDELLSERGARRAAGKATTDGEGANPIGERKVHRAQTSARQPQIFANVLHRLRKL